MEFKAIEQGENVVFTLSGQLTYRDVNEFTQKAKYLDGKSPKVVELDFSELDHIDSMGMGLLIKLHDAGEKEGYSTVIRNAKGRVLELLKAAQFDHLFDMR